jgi:hypothetical protein
MMYDELVKDLRESAPKALAEADFDFVEGWLKEAADAIEELSRENESLAKSVNEASDILRRRWIPVTERLPEDRVEVLVSSGMFAPFIEVAFYDGLFYSAWDGETEIAAVTHWMPLPQPPEEGE